MFDGFGKCYAASGKLVKKGYWERNKYKGKKKPKK
jgi:hypothetical protein